MATPDPLSLRERVRTAIDLGESHFREFKSALEGAPGEKVPREKTLIRRDIGEALVAFANADGGELLVGVEDDGTVTGVPHKEVAVETFMDAWRTHVHPDTPLPQPRIAMVELDGSTILYFSLEKGTEFIHLTNDGRCLQRRDRETIPVPSEQIRIERQERISREYDRQYVDGGDPGALDLEMVERVGEEIAPGLSPEKVLQLLDLADYSPTGVRLRRAAVLLLAKDVSRWHPRCQVRILRVAGSEVKAGRDYNVSEDRVVDGCILELISKAWEEIRPYLVETRLGPGGRFEEQVRYPEDACREALTNAIAHRDYATEGRAIEVYVFDHRLEVKSPGPLLANVTIEGIRSLKGAHQSRNTVIARTLRELGYMREMGEGFRRIFQLMRAHDLVEPEISSDGESFVISLQHRSVFSEEDQRWISAYEQFDLERDEEKVLLLGRRGERFSVDQIMGALDLVDTEDYRDLVERLQQKGLLLSARTTRRTGERTRSAPRWKIVQPKDANAHYGELLAAAQRVYRGSPVTRHDYARVGSMLSPSSSYSPRAVAFSLRRLGLVDASGDPTGRLRAVIDQNEPPATGHAGEAADVPVSPGQLELPDPGEEGPDERRSSGNVAPEAQKLFVGNLPFGLDEAELAAAFGVAGKVVKAVVPRDIRRQRRSRGYGFVEMDSVDAAKRAKKELDGTELGGRTIQIEWARA